MRLHVFLIMFLGLSAGALLGRTLSWPPIPLAGLGGLLAMLGYGWLSREGGLHREALWGEAIGVLGAGFAAAPLLGVHWGVGVGVSGAVWAMSLAFRAALMRLASRP